MIMTSNSIRNNKTSCVKREEPTCWCKGAYSRHLQLQGYKISQVKSCTRKPEECFGSHSEKIKRKSFIEDWEVKDKTNFDIFKLVNNIISTSKQLMDRVYNPELCTQIKNIDNMSFEEVISFWHDFECHYGNIRKQLPWKSQGVSDKMFEKCRYKEDVPSIKLSDFSEDDIWALERTLQVCDAHFDIISNKEKTHLFESLCVGGYCCKWGVHDLSQYACLQNLQTGICDCPSSDDILKTKLSNNSKIAELKQQLQPSLDENGWVNVISKQTKTSIIEQIQSLETENSKLCRKVHYTEKGMIPYNIRLAEASKTTKSVDLHKIVIKSTISVMKKKIV